VLSIHLVQTIDGYLKTYAGLLVRKAQEVFTPLHIPGRDPLPGFSSLGREPYDPQQHVIVATAKMLRKHGGGLVCGQMGTGKTIIGMAVADLMGRGRKGYRVIIMCPDSLVPKWRDEIKETIPNAIVWDFDNWRDCLKIYSLIGSQSRHNKRWIAPTSPEYYIVGRDQSKLDPDWRGLGDPYVGFDGKERRLDCSRKTIVGYEYSTDYDSEQNAWIEKKTPIKTQVYRCPKCGQTIVDKKGQPVGVDKIQSKMSCTNNYLVEVASASKKDCGLDVIVKQENNGLHKFGGGSLNEMRVGKKIKHPDTGKQYQVVQCGAQLWTYTRKPNRWAPARFIHKKLRGAFDLCIVDEVHEAKSDESAQGMAAGKIMSSARHVLGMTGTIIGGYAHHLFPILMRICPRKLVDEGFKWGGFTDWAKRYGRVQRIVTTSQEEGGGEVNVGRRVSSMRRARTGRSSERTKIVPGVMPIMFSRHLVERCVFLSLRDMANKLPLFTEYTGCPIDKEDDFFDPSDPYWINTRVEMEPKQKEEYGRIQSLLDAANKDKLKRGSMKLLGTTLHTLLEYPDRPWDWKPDHEGTLSVGCYEKPNDKTKENWHGVVTPADLDREVVYPKEQKLIDICKTEVKHGSQVWVYVQMTGKRDIQPRLQALLEKEGLRVAILRARNVKPRARIEWLEKNGSKYDVVISHPKPVCLGMELFSKKAGGCNYNALVFYQPGYSMFVAEQASKRSWRLGQPKDCRVYWMYYEGTMEHRAVSIMSQKVMANSSLDGEVSQEGIAAMAGDGDAALSLCRSISEQINDEDILRRFKKIDARKDEPEPTPEEEAEREKEWQEFVENEVAQEQADFLVNGQLALAGPVGWPCSPDGNDEDEEDAQAWDSVSQEEDEDDEWFSDVFELMEGDSEADAVAYVDDDDMGDLADLASCEI
jgi:hypothetical protein